MSDRLLRTVIISSDPSPGWHETVRPSSAAAEAIMVPAIGPRISASWSLGLAWALVAASRGGSHSSALSFILPSSAQAASSAYSRRARFWSKLNIDYQHQPSTSTSTSVQAADRLETDESSAGVTTDQAQTLTHLITAALQFYIDTKYLKVSLPVPSSC